MNNASGGATSMSQARVLIVCTGNSCRSQMAEGLMRVLAAGRKLDLEVCSGGTRPSFVHPIAVTSMAEIGIDISRQKSKSVFVYVGQRFDYVITVCGDAAEVCPVFPGKSQRLHWPIEDPARARGDAEQIRVVFARIRDELQACIDRWLGETFPTTDAIHRAP